MCIRDRSDTARVARRPHPDRYVPLLHSAPQPRVQVEVVLLSELRQLVKADEVKRGALIAVFVISIFQIAECQRPASGKMPCFEMCIRDRSYTEYHPSELYHQL